jgi:hypothetical protein
MPQFTIQIRTAVALRGDFWALGLSAHDPRGHRTLITEQPEFREYRAAYRFRASRYMGASIKRAAEHVELIALLDQDMGI